MLLLQEERRPNGPKDMLSARLPGKFYNLQSRKYFMTNVIQITKPKTSTVVDLRWYTRGTIYGSLQQKNT